MSETIEDYQFGKLTWNDDIEAWVGESAGPAGSSVEVLISTPKEDQRAITQGVRKNYGLVFPRDDLARQKVCDELWELHIRRSSQFGAVDPFTFKRRLILESINLYADGTAEIGYRDDGMLGGTTIVVELDATGIFSDVGLGF